MSRFCQGFGGGDFDTRPEVCVPVIPATDATARLRPYADYMTTTQGIEVSGVRRSFGDVHAVRDASFTALPGTVTGLIGPNGSGKTTLMLMLASLLKPDSGSIRIAGHDPATETAAVRSQLGWMPDVLGSWSSLSVRTTLQITGRLYKLEKYLAVQRAEELLLLVGLGHLADQPTRVLSRGQKQRLSLARALVHDPSVLLLDEPASGLDPAARVDLRTLVRRVASEGKTVLVSSHVLAELDEMADGAVYIGAGITASDETMAATRQSLRQWRIKAADATALETALVDLGTYRGDIARDRTELLVPVAGEAAAAELLARLMAAGIPISTFAPAVGDLEHSFLDLSKGGN
jgi:ABC-2 type transport system ATP-binding protein